jgi:murein DD-endopeptidase MepM/ murein hydrolase activator NlpD
MTSFTLTSSVMHRRRIAGLAAAVLTAILVPGAFAQAPCDSGAGNATPVINAPNPVVGSDGRLNMWDPTRGQGAGWFLAPRLNSDGTVANYHQGVDVAAPVGTMVQSRVDGQVIRSIDYPPPYSTAQTPPPTVLPPIPYNAAGNRVVVRGDDGCYYSYFHLNGQGQPAVCSEVAAGQVIGYVGRTGNVPPQADSHLHTEVHCNGMAIDPNIPRASAPTPTPAPPSPAGNAPSDATLYMNDNAPRVPYSASGQPLASGTTAPNSAPVRVTGYTYDQNAPRTAVSGPMPQPSQAPVIPSVTQRAPGTQSQTAALEFPGN